MNTYLLGWKNIWMKDIQKNGVDNMLSRIEPLNWPDLNYWNSGEWQVVEERLDKLDQDKKRYCPSRINMFNALDATSVKDVKVAIIGQDPYPDPKFASGFAFSIPKLHKDIPVTLKNIFQEYCTDLHYPTPTHGNLEEWTKQGVLLWNAIPTCDAWASMSHDWTEYEYLTREIVEHLSNQGVVFAFLGSVARRYTKYVATVANYSTTNGILKIVNNYVIETSHPSPRGIMNSSISFVGSRFFTTINAHLHSLEKEPINWRL
jgi:uracil-DNA glycosylase